MIEFLAEQLGIPTSNARILYDQWLDNALNTLSNGKPVTIDGLGSFTYQNNELAFSPAPALELDVNRAYAGLEPLPEEKLGPTKFSETDFDDPFMEIIASKYFEPNREPELEIPAPVIEPEFVPDPFEAEPAFAEEHVFAMEPVPVPDSESEPETQPDEEKTPVDLKPWLIAAVLLGVLAVGGYFGLGLYENWMESEIVAEQMVATTPEPSADVPAIVETSTGYGLTGASTVLEGRVYGIIVHSLPIQSDSEAQCAKILPLGYRCSVVAVVRNGATTYRVAIGQFESTEAAQASIADLPAEYQTPGNFFISRIQ